jgi:hypothetical protein
LSSEALSSNPGLPRKEGRREGRKERRKEGRKEGKKEGRKASLTGPVPQ